MARFTSVVELGVSTPCVRLRRYADQQLIVKLEGESPSGCIFDRLVVWQVRQALDQKLLTRASTILVEEASAFTVSWAWVAAALHLKLIYQTNEATPPIVDKLLTALGAVPHSAEQIAARRLDSEQPVMCVSEQTFGDWQDGHDKLRWSYIREVIQELGPALRVLVLPILSDLLAVETSHYLRQHAPAVRLVLVQLHMEPEQPALRVALRPYAPDDKLWAALADNADVVAVDLVTACDAALEVARSEGLLTDPETAAAVAVARQIHQQSETRPGITAVVAGSNGLRQLEHLCAWADTCDGLERGTASIVSDEVLAQCTSSAAYALLRSSRADLVR